MTQGLLRNSSEQNHSFSTKNTIDTAQHIFYQSHAPPPCYMPATSVLNGLTRVVWIRWCVDANPYSSSDGVLMLILSFFRTFVVSVGWIVYVGRVTQGLLCDSHPAFETNGTENSRLVFHTDRHCRQRCMKYARERHSTQYYFRSFKQKCSV